MNRETIAAGDGDPTRNLAWPDDSVGRIMEPPTAVFPPDLTVQQTVERIRERFVTEGLDPALVAKSRAHPPREPVLDGTAEARLIALACSATPDGRKAWTLRMLADKLVELEVVDTVSHETVRRALKKTC